MAGDILRALSLYAKLISFAWIDDSIETDNTLLSLIHVIRDHQHPLRELTIRTHSDLGTEVWSKLNTLTGLHSISLWCMEGPPRVLQGWSEPLGSTLSHLELGVSVFPCPPAECTSQNCSPPPSLSSYRFLVLFFSRVKITALCRRSTDHPRNSSLTSPPPHKPPPQRCSSNFNTHNPHMSSKSPNPRHRISSFISYSSSPTTQSNANIEITYRSHKYSGHSWSR